MKEKRTVRISVRNLVEFLLRSGDLTGGSGRLSDHEAMLAGGRIHRKLQGRRGSSYRAETALKETIDFEDFFLTVEGRADGIDQDTKGAVIEEIKGVYQDVSELESPVPVHLAQAKCYACIYGKQQELETIRIRMVYCNLETEELRTFTSSHKVKDLCEWFQALCSDYRRWAALRISQEDKRNDSIRTLEFPFPYRKGQRDMVVAVYRTILQHKRLFVQAPTGVGKTLSAVFPAVRALGEGAGGRIFYLTAKTVARTVAEEAFSILEKNGLFLKSLTLTAKEKICVCDEAVCDPEHCPRAAGHYDRINDALYEMLAESSDFTRGSILARSEKHRVCPYEMQMDLTAFTDAVICDYNYVFDPAARLTRFFGEGAGKGEAILLIDEAHNLIDRGREMFSAVLEKDTFLQIRKRFREEPRLKAADRAAGRCNKVLLSYRRACEEDAGAFEAYGSRVSLRKEIQELIPPLMSLAGAMEQYLKEEPAENELLTFYFEISTFLGIYDMLDDHYLIYAEKTGRTGLRLKLLCVDPSQALEDTLNRCAAAVWYSATMLPMQYYESLLTVQRDNYRMMIPSPFDPSNRMLAIGTDVSTRYRMRGPEMYDRIAAYMHLVTGKKAGNYIVFFSSYRMLEDVLEAYLTLYPSAEKEQNILVQKPGMREEEREAFLKQFENNAKEQACVLLGMCVMGGIFAEGIDLAGDQLIGAIVVGTGLPQVSGERELLKNWYDAHGKNGFDYAYRFPGLNKVLQAAGRVIRTEEDTGVILLLDERFRSRSYYELFPPEWRDLRLVNAGNAEQEIERFWQKDAHASARTGSPC